MLVFASLLSVHSIILFRTFYVVTLIILTGWGEIVNLYFAPWSCLCVVPELSSGRHGVVSER